MRKWSSPWKTSIYPTIHQGQTQEVWPMTSRVLSAILGVKWILWIQKLSLSNVCLFGCFVSHEQFFSYLATVTITGDGAANLDLCLALTAFSSEGSFTCHTYCDTGPPFLRSYPKDPWFSLLNAVLLAKKQSLPILNVLGLTRPVRMGLKLTTSRLLSESTTTRLLQPLSNGMQPINKSLLKISFEHSFNLDTTDLCFYSYIFF
jgi:hypothetical protein